MSRFFQTLLVLLATLLAMAALLQAIVADAEAPDSHPDASWVAANFPVAQAGARTFADAKPL